MIGVNRIENEPLKDPEKGASRGSLPVLQLSQQREHAAVRHAAAAARAAAGSAPAALMPLHAPGVVSQK